MVHVLALRVALSHRELEHKVVLLSGFHDHAPETIGEIDHLPVDLTQAGGLEHMEQQGGQHHPECFHCFLLGSILCGLIDGWMGLLLPASLACSALYTHVHFG